MKWWLKDLLTEADGESIDVAIVMGLASLLVFFLLTGYSLVVKQDDFKPLDFAGAAALIMGSTGGAARLKPQAPINSNDNKQEKT